MLMFCFFCLKSDADPFMLAEVWIWMLKNKSLCVHWWTPTSLSRQKQQLFQNMTFTPEMDKVHIKNRIRVHQCGDWAPKFRPFSSVWFSFLLISWQMTKDCHQKCCKSSVTLAWLRRAQKSSTCSSVLIFFYLSCLLSMLLHCHKCNCNLCYCIGLLVESPLP